MSARTLCRLRCDRDGCMRLFDATSAKAMTYVRATDARAEAALAGWTFQWVITRPGGRFLDLCPEHATPQSTPQLRYANADSEDAS